MIVDNIFQHKKMQETQNPTECNIVKIIHLFGHQMSPKEIFKRFKGRADFSESVCSCHLQRILLSFLHSILSRAIFQMRWVEIPAWSSCCSVWWLWWSASAAPLFTAPWWTHTPTFAQTSPKMWTSTPWTSEPSLKGSVTGCLPTLKTLSSAFLERKKKQQQRFEPKRTRWRRMEASQSKRHDIYWHWPNLKLIFFFQSLELDFEQSCSH